MTKLEQAQEFIKQGDKVRARTVLSNLVQSEPQNSNAWLLLAMVLDDPKQVTYCNERARVLQSQTPSKPELTGIPQKSIDRGVVDSTKVNDFITMSCPSCGGNLSISPNMPTLICQYCGVEHMIRREAGSVLLESFARCPQCSRNDKVQKVSAVLASQPYTPLAQKLSPPDMPIAPTQPQPPMHKTQVTSSVVASIVLGLIILLGYFLVKETLFLCSGLFVIAFGVVPALDEVRQQEQRKRDYQSWKQGVQNYEKAMVSWNLEIELWRELYYCARDDSVFVLGNKIFAPSSQITSYVRKLQEGKIKNALAKEPQTPITQYEPPASQAVSITPWIVLILVLGAILGGSILLAVLFK